MKKKYNVVLLTGILFSAYASNDHPFEEIKKKPGSEFSKAPTLPKLPMSRFEEKYSPLHTKDQDSFSEDNDELLLPPPFYNLTEEDLMFPFEENLLGGKPPS